MKRLLLILVLTCFALELSAQQQLIQVVGRMYAVPSQAAYQQFMADNGNSMWAEPGAYNAVINDGAARWAKALDDLRSHDSKFFDATMATYGLSLQSH